MMGDLSNVNFLFFMVTILFKDKRIIRKAPFFHSDKNWYGKNPPTLEELKNQTRHGDFTCVSKLRYYSQSIRGSDGYWRNKTNELRAWIDFNVLRRHGPPTHLITLTCAENWWTDLREIYATLEQNAGNKKEVFC